jgi:hypothetical protein
VHIDVTGGTIIDRARIAEAIYEMLLDYKIPTETTVKGIDGAMNHASAEKVSVLLAAPVGYEEER